MTGARPRGGDEAAGAAVHRGFGLTFTCEVELAGLPASRQAEPPDLEVRLAPVDELERSWSGPCRPPAAVDRRFPDGCAYGAERGAAGDHRFSYGDRARFHLSADRRILLCAPARVGDHAWRRVLLDSVLATVSLLRGHEALHASAVAGSGGVVAFVGRTGGGKTVLAAELVRRGLPLVCDDVLALERTADGIVAHPAPPLMNLPLAAPGGLEPAVLGQEVAILDGESWLCVARAATEPAPVAAVCLLERAPGLAAGIRSTASAPLELLAHALRSGRSPERMELRFELLADLVDQAPAYVLEADVAVEPGRLADLALSAIPALASDRAPAAAGGSR